MDIATPTPLRRYEKYRAHNQSVDDNPEITPSEPGISQWGLIRKWVLTIDQSKYVPSLSFKRFPLFGIIGAL